LVLEQIHFLQDYIRKLEGKIILLGDFNISYKKLRPHLEEFDLVSEGVKTCSTTPIMKWFYNKDVDHILVRGFKPNKSGTIEGESDHKLIYVDLSRK
jgi:endonuclease/exonuclease/phosphatase (EEP) superfamily protein YafD